jgi:hypothetical protein
VSGKAASTERGSGGAAANATDVQTPASAVDATMRNNARASRPAAITALIPRRPVILRNVLSVKPKLPDDDSSGASQMRKFL